MEKVSRDGKLHTRLMPLELDSKVDHKDQLHMGHFPGSARSHVYIIREVLSL
jgi:hypothetical protein